ncbi:hypothetical protein [Riemerella columbina]|uniref:hypothetical protein n=1 Tax=Riemerella columbina TaxID=103810 RepID=UPI000360DAFC|nr:hypothetical protein [Riemerella columbina]
MKYIILILGLIINFSYAQIVTIDRLSDVKKIEINKDKFIGKPLSYLLATIKVPIKSIQAIPNKNRSEINTLTFRYITYDEYHRVWIKNSIEEGPTQLVVKFNQNWNTSGNLCRPKENPQCAEWLPEDEKNLGDLIIYDIVVLGKN